MGNETRRYVFRIHAIKLILNNPNNYGFFVKESDYYEDDGFEVMNTPTTVKWGLKYSTREKEKKKEKVTLVLY